MSAEEIEKYVRNPKGVKPGLQNAVAEGQPLERELDEVASSFATLK